MNMARAEEIAKANKWLAENFVEVVAFLKTAVNKAKKTNKG